MILLPHGCKCSEIKVLPKNWKSTKKINGNWKIYYRFYDPNFKKKPKWGKLIPIKGMNHIKDITERREATKMLIEDEYYALRVEGYNPITKQSNGPDIKEVYDIPPETPFLTALDHAALQLNVARNTMLDIQGAKKYFKKSALSLGYQKFRICDVRKKDVRSVLNRQAVINSYSDSRFNKVRAYMMMIFKQLLEIDAIDYNPVIGISKRKTTKKIIDGFTNSELTRIKVHLRKTVPEFYNYCEIFYHSGCRSTELMRLKVRNVNLDKQEFKVLVLKGRKYEEQKRAINTNSLHLWERLCRNANPEHFVFGKGLVPGPESIQARQISYRWRRHVKNKLGIEGDFYWFKHTHTTKVIDLYGEDLASSVNGHKSKVMNRKHYDLNHKQRLLDQAKVLKVSF